MPPDKVRDGPGRRCWLHFALRSAVSTETQRMRAGPSRQREQRVSTSGLTQPSFSRSCR